MIKRSELQKTWRRNLIHMIVLNVFVALVFVMAFVDHIRTGSGPSIREILIGAAVWVAFNIVIYVFGRFFKEALDAWGAKG